MSNTNSPRTDNAYLAQQGYKPGAPIRRITLNATGIKVDPALPLVISSNGAGGVRYAMGEQQNQTAIDEATLFTQDRAQSTPAYRRYRCHAWLRSFVGATEVDHIKLAPTKSLATQLHRRPRPESVRSRRLAAPLAASLPRP